MNIATYILTCNAPLQLDLLLKSYLHNISEIFDYDIIIADQSTVVDDQKSNEKIISQYTNKYQHIILKNLGCSGGRYQIAKLFNESLYDNMFFFEDDMTINYHRDTCRFGFKSYVDNLIKNSYNILLTENLDYLKLSFHEVFNDHSHIFPSGEDTVFYKIAHLNIPYLIGEIYFSNWPLLISKNGNKKLFNFDNMQIEIDLAIKSIDLIRNNQLKAGVLCAYPIQHKRIQNIIDHQR